jgi:nucleoid-associated protein
MSTLNLIVHEVQKEEADRKDADASRARITFRDDENRIDEHSENLSNQLRELFRKTGLSTGEFSAADEADGEAPEFKQLLERSFDGRQFADFVKFSKDATYLFKKELDRSPPSKGGYLWFNHYVYGGEHFLSVVLLRKKKGLRLGKDLSLAEIEQLDLDKLHMAARLNLSAWLEGKSTRYISFRVGQGATEVTNYFSLFVGCAEYRRDKADTANMIHALRAYCSFHNWNENKIESVKQSLYDKCVEWRRDEVPVMLDAISEYLDALHVTPDGEKGIFLEKAQRDFELSNHVPINSQELNKLRRYSGRNSNISISFKSGALNVTVFYDAKSEELRVTDVPDELKLQLGKKKDG